MAALSSLPSFNLAASVDVTKRVTRVVLIAFIFLFCAGLRIEVVSLAALTPFIIRAFNKEDPDKRALRRCTGLYSESRCACMLSGSCECVRVAFETDREWKRYKFLACTVGQVLPRTRLLESYSPDNCINCSTACKSELAQIQSEIRSFACSDETSGGTSNGPLDGFTYANNTGLAFSYGEIAALVPVAMTVFVILFKVSLALLTRT